MCPSRRLILQSRGQQMCNPFVEIPGEDWVCMHRQPEILPIASDMVSQDVPPFTHGVFHWAVRLMMSTMMRGPHAVTLTPPSEAAANIPGAGGQVYS